MDRHTQQAGATEPYAEARDAKASDAKAPAAPPDDTPAALCEAALRLMKAGQLLEAEQHGRRALALDGGHADSLHLMGALSFAAGHHDRAIEWFALAIRQNPNVADYFSNLGTVLQSRERYEEAIKSFARALVLRPDLPEVWFRMGRMLQQQKRIDEAILSFDQTLKFDASHREAANSGALLHYESGRYDEARARFEQSLQIDAGQAGVLNFKGLCLLHLGRPHEALVDFGKGCALAPDHADLANNLGLVLQRLDRHEEALPHFDKAISLRAAYASAYYNRGISLAELHRFDEAFESYAKAVEITPDYAEAHLNNALTRLLVGDFEAGWTGQEWGRKTPATGLVDRQFIKPRWFGHEPIAGKTILLYSDQGFGDSIQLARYVPLVAQLGARVILETNDILRPLLCGLEGLSLCLPNIGATLPDFDLYSPLSGLPAAFKTRLDTIPPGTSYLPRPPSARVETWEERLGSHDKLRVGVVWSGNPAHGNDRKRSMALSTMCRIVDADARFVSLQKYPRSTDQQMLKARADIADLTEFLSDFMDTAALVSCLDLVITVDTSAAHLAGALGRPTWVLLPYTPDHRWLLDRDDSPWYPTVRLFRQTESRDWAHVLDRVRRELAKEIALFNLT